MKYILIFFFFINLKAQEVRTKMVTFGNLPYVEVSIPIEHERVTIIVFGKDGNYLKKFYKVENSTPFYIYTYGQESVFLRIRSRG